MNSAELNEQLEKSKRFKRNLIIGSTIALIGTVIGTLSYLFLVEDKALPEDLPPIIIKSGSFIFETDTELIPNIDGQPIYTRTFNNVGIKGIRVTTLKKQKKESDDDYFYEGKHWDSGQRVEVNIKILLCEVATDNVCVRWSQNPQIIRIYDTDDPNNQIDQEKGFNMSTSIPISKSEIKPKTEKRAFKNEDMLSVYSRFGEVNIINVTTGEPIKSYDSKDYQEYIIAFYDKLP